MEDTNRCYLLVEYKHLPYVVLRVQRQRLIEASDRGAAGVAALALQSIYSFRMYLDWIPSAENPIADAVSREEWGRFYAVAAANNYPPSALRRVQMLPRSSIVSLMISMKRSAKHMLIPP